MATLAERVAAKRAQIAADNTRTAKSYKFPVGKTLIRLFPDKKDPTGADAERQYGQHWIKTLDGTLVAVIGDRKITYGEEDAVRNAILSNIKTAMPDVKEHLLKEVLAKPRFIVNGVVIGQISSDKKVVPDANCPPTQPTTFEYSPTAWDEILSVFEIYIENGEDPYDLKDGVTLLVERTGTGAKDTVYKYNAIPKKYPLDAALLEKATDLDAHIKAMFAENEAKALGVISEILGKPISSLPSSAAAALTDGRSTAAANDKGISTSFTEDETETAPFTDVEDADFEPVVAEATTKSVEPTTTKKVVEVDASDDDIASLLGDLAA